MQVLLVVFILAMMIAPLLVFAAPLILYVLPLVLVGLLIHYFLRDEHIGNSHS